MGKRSQRGEPATAATMSAMDRAYAELDRLFEADLDRAAARRRAVKVLRGVLSAKGEDCERAHGDADKAVEAFLRALGEDKVADLYEEARRGTWCA